MMKVNMNQVMIARCWRFMVFATAICVCVTGYVDTASAARDENLNEDKDRRASNLPQKKVDELIIELVQELVFDKTTGDAELDKKYDVANWAWKRINTIKYSFEGNFSATIRSMALNRLESIKLWTNLGSDVVDTTSTDVNLIITNVNIPERREKGIDGNKCYVENEYNLDEMGEIKSSTIYVPAHYSEKPKSICVYMGLINALGFNLRTDLKSINRLIDIGTPRTTIRDLTFKFLSLHYKAFRTRYFDKEEYKNSTKLTLSNQELREWLGLPALQ